MSRTPEVGCPTWCIVRHGKLLGEEDQVHSSAELRVGQVTMRLCASTANGRGEGPIVLVGDHELTLYETEVLADALTQLVDLVASSLPQEEVLTGGSGTHP